MTVITRQQMDDQINMAIYDRVGIVKDSTGMFSGSGDPWATVNLIRKKPTREFKASIYGSAGSWDTYGTEADISGPLTDDGGVSGRFVTADKDGNSYRDHYSAKEVPLGR